jgi:hypothetical protein
MLYLIVDLSFDFFRLFIGVVVVVEPTGVDKAAAEAAAGALKPALHPLMQLETSWYLPSYVSVPPSHTVSLSHYMSHELFLLQYMTAYLLP